MPRNDLAITYTPVGAPDSLRRVADEFPCLIVRCAYAIRYDCSTTNALIMAREMCNSEMAVQNVIRLARAYNLVKFAGATEETDELTMARYIINTYAL